MQSWRPRIQSQPTGHIPTVPFSTKMLRGEGSHCSFKGTSFLGHDRGRQFHSTAFLSTKASIWEVIEWNKKLGTKPDIKQKKDWTIEEVDHWVRRRASKIGRLLEKHVSSEMMLHCESHWPEGARKCWRRDATGRQAKMLLEEKKKQLKKEEEKKADEQTITLQPPQETKVAPSDHL